MSKNIIKGSNVTLVTLLLLLLLLEGARTTTCAIECASVANSCVVCFQNCPAPVPTYTFYNCSQERTYNSQSQSGQSTSQTTISIYSQKQCEQQCCASQLARFGNPSFSECSGEALISGIQLIVIGSIMAAIIICLFICCCNKSLREKVAGCLCVGSMKESDEKNVNNSVEAAEKLKGTISKENLNEAGETANKIDLRTCPICLCSSCEVSIPCGHCFHLQCLNEWYLRSKNCPECKDKPIEVVNLYCAACHNPLHQEIRMSLVQKFKITISRQSLCSECVADQ